MVLVGVVKSQRSARERHVARGGDGLQEVPAEQMLNLERGREDRVSTCVEGEHECMAEGMEVADKEASAGKRKRLQPTKRKVAGCKERQIISYTTKKKKKVDRNECK